MNYRLVKASGGLVVIDVPGRKSFLRRHVRCGRCGKKARLDRIVTLHPCGMRGYFQCRCGHLFPIDRDGMRRIDRQARDRVWLSA